MIPPLAYLSVWAAVRRAVAHKRMWTVLQTPQGTVYYRRGALRYSDGI